MESATWNEAGDGTVVVTVLGEIDVNDAADLRRVIADAVSQVRPARLQVDLRHVPFVDSSGLGALIGGYRHALAAGAQLMLLNPSPFVLSLLQITGMDTVLTVAFTEREAP